MKLKSPVTMISSLALSVLTSGFAFADQVFNEDVIIKSNVLCLGPFCNEDIPSSSVRLELFGFSTGIRFYDLPSDLHEPFEDSTWEILPNGDDFRTAFVIRNWTYNNDSVVISAGARDNSLFIDHDGRIGMGTSVPTNDFHIKTGNNPSVRLEQDGSGGFIPQTWDFAGNGTLFFVRDVTNGNKLPFVVRAGAPSNALGINSNGNVGVGTSVATEQLHVRGPGNQVTRIESTNRGNSALQLKSASQQRKIVALNAANQVQSQILMYNEQIRLIGPNGDPANTYLIAGPGGISTRGPSCNPGPCDATFDPDAFTVPSIEEHAAYMWENQHLWGVGPTSSDQMINLTEKTGGMLHELEVAHIYIEQLHHRLEAQTEEKSALTERVKTQEYLALQQSAIIADLTKRLEALETQ